jgi:hypothetical protein
MESNVTQWFPHARLVSDEPKGEAHYTIPKQEMDRFLRHLPFFLEYPARKEAPKLSMEDFMKQAGIDHA